MPRFTKQRDRYSCGPVAILNALRWSGTDAPYEDLIDILQKVCNCEPGRGTNHTDFDAALRFFGTDLFRVRRVHRPCLSTIEEHLQADGAVILNYRWFGNGRHFRHFALACGVSPDGRDFYVVNDSRHGPALQGLRRKDFVKETLRYQRVDPHFKGWFLTQE